MALKQLGTIRFDDVCYAQCICPLTDKVHFIDIHDPKLAVNAVFTFNANRQLIANKKVIGRFYGHPNFKFILGEETLIEQFSTTDYIVAERTVIMKLLMIEKTIVLTYNHGALIRVVAAGEVLHDTDLTPKPYWQVCWAHGWSGNYSSEEEAVEECYSLCGHARSVRVINPGDEGYKNPWSTDLKTQTFTLNGVPVL